jgi:hypothetical protein
LEHVHPEKIILSGVAEAVQLLLTHGSLQGWNLLDSSISCGMPFIGEWESVTNSFFKKRVNAEASPLELLREVWGLEQLSVEA